MKVDEDFDMQKGGNEGHFRAKPQRPKCKEVQTICGFDCRGVLIHFTYRQREGEVEVGCVLLT